MLAPVSLCLIRANRTFVASVTKVIFFQMNEAGRDFVDTGGCHRL
jgi:hypothetical protein